MVTTRLNNPGVTTRLNNPVVTTRLNNPGVTTSGVGYQFQRDIMGRGEGEGGG